MNMHQKRKERKEKANSNSNQNISNTNINWFPGHMQKAKNEIIEKLKLVNIVYVVVDARLPFSSFNPMLNDIVKNKPMLILLNKSDLADPVETKKWINYYKQQGMSSIDIDAISGHNMKSITPLTKEILKPVISKYKEKGMNISLRAMIIGVPNAGKSTIINSIVKKKALKVGDKPGITTQLQWIKIDEDIDLLDTPGVLWPKFTDIKIGYSLALSGSIKDDVLPLDDVCLYGFSFLKKHYKDNFYKRYNLNDDLSDLDIYDQIAKLRGCIKNNEVDYDKVNKLFLKDLRGQFLGRITFDKYEEFI